MKALLKELLFYTCLVCLFGMLPGIVFSFWSTYVVPWLIVGVITCVTLGFLLRNWQKDELSIAMETSLLGEIHVQSGLLMMSDSLDQQRRQYAVHVPIGKYEIKGKLNRVENGSILESLLLGEWHATVDEQTDTYEIVVDSGEVVIVDASVIEDEREVRDVDRQLMEARKQLLGVQSYCILRDQTGLSRGIVMTPQYGDGVYYAKSKRSTNSFGLRLNLLADNT